MRVQQACIYFDEIPQNVSLSASRSFATSQVAREELQVAEDPDL